MTSHLLDSLLPPLQPDPVCDAVDSAGRPESPVSLLCRLFPVRFETRHTDLCLYSPHTVYVYTGAVTVTGRYR